MIPKLRSIAAAAMLLTAAPAGAANVEIGTLRCLGPERATPFSPRLPRLTCKFELSVLVGAFETYQTTAYYRDPGEAVLGRLRLVWKVFINSTVDMEPGILAGGYAPADADDTTVAGLGADVLVGGLYNSIALQPLREPEPGNAAAALWGLELLRLQ